MLAAIGAVAFFIGGGRWSKGVKACARCIAIILKTRIVNDQGLIGKLELGLTKFPFPSAHARVTLALAAPRSIAEVTSREIILMVNILSWNVLFCTGEWMVVEVGVLK